MTTPRGYKIEGLVLEEDVRVCGISVAVKEEMHEGYAQVQEVVHTSGGYLC